MPDISGMPPAVEHIVAQPLLMLSIRVRGSGSGQTELIRQTSDTGVEVTCVGEADPLGAIRPVAGLEVVHIGFGTSAGDLQSPAGVGQEIDGFQDDIDAFFGFNSSDKSKHQIVARRARQGNVVSDVGDIEDDLVRRFGKISEPVVGIRAQRRLLEATTSTRRDAYR